MPRKRFASLLCLIAAAMLTPPGALAHQPRNATVSDLFTCYHDVEHYCHSPGRRTQSWCHHAGMAICFGFHISQPGVAPAGSSH